MTPLQIRLAIALSIAAAFAGVVIWALVERSGRLECKVELVAAVDQVKVLAGTLERQGAAIDKLGGQTKQVLDRTGKVLDQLELQGATQRKTIAELEAKVAGKTPTSADGRILGCADYLKEWRAEP